MRFRPRIAPVLLIVASPGSAQDGDIVVRAQKLRDWRAVLVVGAGDAMTCRIVRSTGDENLDARACAAQKRCYEIARPDILALALGRVPAARRRRAVAAVNRAMAACFAAVSRRIAVYPLENPSPVTPGIIDPARRR